MGGSSIKYVIETCKISAEIRNYIILETIYLSKFETVSLFIGEASLSMLDEN